MKASNEDEVSSMQWFWRS